MENVMTPVLRLAVASAVCILILSAIPVLADESWNSLVDDAHAASEPQYALYKLRQAWERASASNDELARNTIKSQMVSTLEASGNAGLANTYKGLSLSEIDQQLARRKCFDSSWIEWRVELSADNSLFFYAPPGTFDHVYDGHAECVKGYPDGYMGVATNDPNDPALIEFAKQNPVLSMWHFRQDQLAKLRAKLPIKLQSGTPKYEDALALCQPIQIGQSKSITFDLTPFVPREMAVLGEY